MATDILEGVTRRVEHLWSLTDQSKYLVPSTTFVLDVKEGLQSCVLLRDYLAQSCRLLWKDVAANEVDDYNLIGRSVLASFDAALRVCEAVQHRALQRSAAGIPPEVTHDFEQALKQLQRAVAELTELRSDFERRWPWLNEAQLMGSLSAENRGAKRRPAREVFDELRRRVR